MKIPQIKFSLDKKNKLSAMRSSFQTFCSRADALMSMNSDSVSLLSLSQKNTNKKSGFITNPDIFIKV